MRNNITIGIAGAGGDGVVMLGSFLQRIAASQGYFSQMPRYYGAQIRGGGSAVKLCLDAEHLAFPKDTLDLLVCFNWEKYFELRSELEIAPNTLVLYENPPTTDMGMPVTSYQIHLSQKSREITGSVVNKNIVALGLLLKLIALAEDKARKTIDQEEELGLLKQHLNALEAGMQLSSQFALPDMALSPSRDRSTKIILHGSWAMARAAVRAGCRAFFGYPITPASEIMQEMHEQLNHGDFVFLQAEDEIAAAGLAVGASFVGARAMTSTSGPGLDLMTEMMGLAISSEIPLVIVDVQRAGPSTGIPSKSEQSDLNHAIYGGHGDAPRVVMAPFDIEGCYRLTIESLNIAQQFQTAVVLLSDQWLGQTLLAINDEFLKKDYPVLYRKAPTTQGDKGYQRYQITDDFISPMSVPGQPGLVYQTTGLTHDEKGQPASGFEAHQKMHEKRWKKLLPLCRRHDLVKMFGNQESGKGIITWGSSAQIVLETVKELGLEDRVKVCVPELICPLPEHIERFLKTTQRLLVVEMNYSGQLHHYLRSQADLPPDSILYSRAGGKSFSRKELAAPITELAR